MIQPTRQRAFAVVIGLLAVVALASHRTPAIRRAPSAMARPARPATAGAAALRDGRQLDLNRATAADLELLPRVGPALAARIVTLRNTRGAFRAVDELDDVPGIGDATLTRLRPYVTVRPLGLPPLARSPPVR